jgi:hypothetical protein
VVLSGMQNSTSAPYLAAINRILISLLHSRKDAREQTLTNKNDVQTDRPSQDAMGEGRGGDSFKQTARLSVYLLTTLQHKRLSTTLLPQRPVIALVRQDGRSDWRTP